MKRLTAVVIFIIVAVALLGILQEIQKDSPGNQKVKEGSSGSLTLSNFKKIKMGMTYKEVAMLIGEGEISSQSEQGKISILIYSWTNNSLFGANCNVIFQNDKVTTKSQIGLK